MVSPNTFELIFVMIFPEYFIYAPISTLVHSSVGSDSHRRSVPVKYSPNDAARVECSALKCTLLAFPPEMVAGIIPVSACTMLLDAHTAIQSTATGSKVEWLSGAFSKVI